MEAIRTIIQERKSFQQNALDDIFHWYGKILGPPDTPFEGGVFILDIIYSREHPYQPPIYTMKTKMFHPNISSTGKISMGVLEHDWRPVLTIEKILLSISSILDTPDMDNPINHQAAQCFRRNRNKYNSIVQEYTLKYANESSINSENDQNLHRKMLHTEMNNSSPSYILNFLAFLVILIIVLVYLIFICFLK